MHVSRDLKTLLTFQNHVHCPSTPATSCPREIRFDAIGLIPISDEITQRGCVVAKIDGCFSNSTDDKRIVMVDVMMMMTVFTMMIVMMMMMMSRQGISG